MILLDLESNNKLIVLDFIIDMFDYGLRFHWHVLPSVTEIISV
jgi:hypothetical protein